MTLLDEDMERYARDGVAINQAGFIAARRGEPRTACPYHTAHWDGQAWLSGWDAGDRAAHQAEHNIQGEDDQ